MNTFRLYFSPTILTTSFLSATLISALALNNDAMISRLRRGKYRENARYCSMMQADIICAAPNYYLMLAIYVDVFSVPEELLRPPPMLKRAATRLPAKIAPRD